MTNLVVLSRIDRPQDGSCPIYFRNQSGNPKCCARTTDYLSCLSPRPSREPPRLPGTTAWETNKTRRRERYSSRIMPRSAAAVCSLSGSPAVIDSKLDKAEETRRRVSFDVKPLPTSQRPALAPFFPSPPFRFPPPSPATWDNRLVCTPSLREMGQPGPATREEVFLLGEYRGLQSVSERLRWHMALQHVMPRPDGGSKRVYYRMVLSADTGHECIAQRPRGSQTTQPKPQAQAFKLFRGMRWRSINHDPREDR